MNSKTKLLFGLILTLVIVLAACNSNDSYKGPHDKDVSTEDAKFAKDYINSHGIPLSVIDTGEFKTKITSVEKETIDKIKYPNSIVSSIIHIWLRQSYKNIEMEPLTALHFFDDKLTESSIIFYPKGEENELSEEMSKDVTFVDFAILPTSPKLSESQARKIAKKSATFSAELKYYMENIDKPDEFKLVWIFRKGSAESIIDAQSGKLIYDFDGIIYG